jgi:hypothetical protein
MFILTLSMLSPPELSSLTSCWVSRQKATEKQRPSPSLNLRPTFRLVVGHWMIPDIKEIMMQRLCTRMPTPPPFFWRKIIYEKVELINNMHIVVYNVQSKWLQEKCNQYIVFGLAKLQHLSFFCLASGLAESKFLAPSLAESKYINLGPGLAESKYFYLAPCLTEFKLFLPGSWSGGVKIFLPGSWSGGVKIFLPGSWSGGVKLFLPGSWSGGVKRFPPAFGLV